MSPEKKMMIIKKMIKHFQLRSCVAVKLRVRMFISVFQVRCWSHHMLLCAPDTVYLALSWIHAIRCSPGDADLLATLSVVFSDRGCHAVHLLCTDLSDHPEAVLTALPALAAGRPVTIFYLQVSHQADRGRTADYLQRLTLATGGRCYAIPVCLNGELKEVCLSYQHSRTEIVQ